MLPVVAGELATGLTYEVCAGCGSLIAVDARRAPEVLARAYDGMPDTYWTELSDDRRFARELEGALRRHARGDELWDVGCGAGALLDKLGRGWRKHGIEPGKNAVNSAVSRGLDVRHGTASTLALDAVADVVCAIDVVEHLLDPLDELRAMRAMLRPGGIVALFTGACDRTTPGLAGRDWYYLHCVGHVTVFSREGLRKLLAHARLEQVETLRIEHGGGVSFGRWARRYLANLARPRLGRPRAALHFFRDHQLVIARRPVERDRE